MRAKRTDFGEGMIIVSYIQPPIDGRDIVIEMHRNDSRVGAANALGAVPRSSGRWKSRTLLTATRAELVRWVDDLAAFIKELRSATMVEGDAKAAPDEEQSAP